VRIRWLLLGVAALALAGCHGGGSNDAASSTTTVVPTTAARVAAAPPGACPPFTGSTTALQSFGPTAPASLTDAAAGADGCLDRVTFTLRSLGNGTPPGYLVGYQDPAKEPFVDGDPPVPISLPGDAFLVVKIAPAFSIDPSVAGQPATYTGNLSLEYGDHHHLQIVRKLPDAQNTVVWVIGLDSVRPFRVDRSEDGREPGIVRVSVLIG
jgi:hypothetical protein